MSRQIHAVSLAVLAACLIAPSASGAATRSFVPTADAYGQAMAPSTNFGTSTSIAATSRQRRIGYLRFDPQGLTGTVTKATLRLRLTRKARIGLGVYAVQNTTWDEHALTFDNRPAYGARALSRRRAARRTGMVSFDVTAAVKGNDTVSLAIVASSGTARISSRETRSRRVPRLTVTTAAAGAPPSPGLLGLVGQMLTPPAPAPPPAAPPAPPAPPAPAPPPALGEQRPYDAASPWNTPIGADPQITPGSLGFVAAVTDNHLPLTSDVDQYAIPVYYFDEHTPLRTVNVENYYSTYDAGDNSRVGHGFAPTITGVPIPETAQASFGSDGQIVLWNPTTGVAYTFWQFDRDASGRYTATNGNRHHTTAGYYGRFADGLAGRGAGTSYLAGLVRPWEVAQGHIDHALAFAYDSPAPSFVYPASKSDGGGALGTDLPEGSRLQLDPTLTDADFTAWGLSPTAKVIAKALQSYGMYVIDHGGSSKIYLEDRLTAKWPATVDRHLTERIPLSRFRVVAAPAPPH